MEIPERTRPIRVLLVEDNPGDARFVREILRASSALDIHHVDCLAAGIEVLAAQKVDVVLLDLGLPDSQGLGTLRSVLATDSAVPVVVLTGQDDEAVGEAAVRAGAQDYLVKGRVADHALTRAVRYAMERAQSQYRDRLTRDVLESLNNHGEGSDPIKVILQLVRKATDLEAVGIRLREGDDFPYYVTNGFSESFVAAERSLCAYGRNGEVQLDGQGNPVLECMCGNVLCGRTDPALPFFTKGGSFWTNGTTELLATTSESDRQGRTRNRCNGEGYESVALIPLRTGNEILGLLQLNDHRKYRFSLEMIHFLEGLGASIGIALERKRAQTELLRANDALAKSAEKWQATFDTISDIVCVLSPAHEILEINTAGCRAIGLPRAQIIGRKCYELVHGLHAPIAECPCRWSIATGLPGTGEHTEHGRTYQLISWPTLDVLGKVASLAHIVKDITEQKRTEESHRLLEEQLRASQKLEAIGSLAGGIAHDFNNLLSVILSYTGFALADLPEGVPLRDDLAEVQRAGEHAATLTRQLLAFSRKQLLQPVPLCLNQIAAGLEKMLRRILGEDIDLVQALAPDLGVVRADPGQIEQVLMNLVVNARDAMPRGGKLTIETDNVELDSDYAQRHVAVSPGLYVRLVVTDTGCGMDAPTQAKLFEPFFTTKEKGKGTGLGLSTVYGIVKQSGGNIWVYSEPGKGTTFKIYLPREEAATAVDTVAKPAAKLTVGNEILLVVEDEEALLKVARRILEAAGYGVLTAADGDEALRICADRGDEIQLVLTDVVMPRMSGRALAEALAKTRPALKVLYMSGYTDDAILHHGLLDPGTHFLGKPFSAQELTRKVRDVLDAG